MLNLVYMQAFRDTLFVATQKRFRASELKERDEEESSDTDNKKLKYNALIFVSRKENDFITAQFFFH